MGEISSSQGWCFMGPMFCWKFLFRVGKRLDFWGSGWDWFVGAAAADVSAGPDAAPP